MCQSHVSNCRSFLLQLDLPVLLHYRAEPNSRANFTHQKLQGIDRKTWAVLLLWLVGSRTSKQTTKQNKLGKFSPTNCSSKEKSSSNIHSPIKIHTSPIEHSPITGILPTTRYHQYNIVLHWTSENREVVIKILLHTRFIFKNIKSYFANNLKKGYPIWQIT